MGEESRPHGEGAGQEKLHAPVGVEREGLAGEGQGEGVRVDERSMQGQRGGKFHHLYSGKKARFHFLRSCSHLTIL